MPSRVDSCLLAVDQYHALAVSCLFMWKHEESKSLIRMPWTRAGKSMRLCSKMIRDVVQRTGMIMIMMVMDACHGQPQKTILTFLIDAAALHAKATGRSDTTVRIKLGQGSNRAH